jgi:hypothetical protein
MRKLIAGACILALAATASPALAGGGQGGGNGNAQQTSNFTGDLGRFVNGFWGRQGFFGTPPGFSSPGKHWGWFRGKHWGWFKPHHPHWPHHPTSP